MPKMFTPLSADRLKEKLANSPAPKITRSDIEARIANIEFTAIDLTTICTLTFDNGFTVRGEGSCVNPENYDVEIGQHFAYEDAIKKSWPFFGWNLAESQWKLGEKAAA